MKVKFAADFTVVSFPLKFPKIVDQICFVVAEHFQSLNKHKEGETALTIDKHNKF